MNFSERAKFTASKGVPVIRVRPNSKIPFDVGWPELATTDFSVIDKWNAETPDANCGSVAFSKPGGFFFFETDSNDVLDRIIKETGHDLLKEVPTFKVRSRAGRGHQYFRHNAKSLACENIHQGYVKHGDFSVRMDRQFVVSAHSIHPHSLQPYTPLDENAPILECPDWLIDWFVEQKISKIITSEDIKKDSQGMVRHGSVHTYLVSRAAELKQKGIEGEILVAALVDIANKNCEPPVDFEKVKAIARDIHKRYPTGTPLILTQAPEPVPEPEIPEFEDIKYPEFPRWVMEGTSLFENYVKPVCAVNSRIDYMMWIPAMQMMLNNLGTKIKIKKGLEARPFRGSMFTVLIGRKGKTNKTSSVNDGLAQFAQMGVLSNATKDIKNADGKTLVWTAGSPEGLGIEMQKTGCKNALLFYDELSQLVSKAGIDSSTLTSALLTTYEASKFSNSIKGARDAYSHEPDTYCLSLIACTTDRKFSELWSKLAGTDTGLDDRFFFVLQPDPLPEPRTQEFVNTALGAIETRKRIDKAVNQGVFEYDEYVLPHPGLDRLVRIENRYANRAEKWATAIAIDLGLSALDSESVERGVAIVEYEIAVKKYLRSYEALTREGQIQGEIRRVLEFAKGKMPKKQLMKEVHAERYGTTLWGQSYRGLLGNGYIRELPATAEQPLVEVQLLIKREIEDE